MSSPHEMKLPSHASVVVIGGGVMGCSTLYHLAKRGVSDAILLEQNQLTSGTTWHSAAQVRALRSSRNLTDLIRYSISLYSGLEEETGQATGWINKGSLSIATTEDRLVHIRRQEAMANLFGVQAESISVAEAQERWPLMNSADVIGAVWSPDDGRVSASDLCAALVKGARIHGANVFEGVAVTGILESTGRIIGIETERGTVRCDAIALCTGLWSRKMAAMAKVEVPVWSCEHFYLLTRGIDDIRDNLPTLSDHDSHLYIRDDSGGLLIGCFEPIGKAIDPERFGRDAAFRLLPEDWDHFEPMMHKALHRIPVLEQVEVKTLLNGPESFTPDGTFLLGEAGETRGLYLGCGMNSVGVASAGGAGLALAHCILDGHPPMDLHELDPKRFPGCHNSAAFLAERVPEVLGKHYEITYPGRQWRTGRNLRKLPLHDHWMDAGAHFGQVYGFERPLFFSAEEEPVLTFSRPDWFKQVGREVRFAHEQAAIFDQSSLGKISVTGRDSESFLDRLCTNDMKLLPGGATFTLMLNRRGGIESDLIVQRLEEEWYRLYTGTSSIRRDMAWLLRHRNHGEEVILRDETEDHALLSLTGPDAARIAHEVGAPELNTLGYYRHCEAGIAGVSVRAIRISYVGESGWELACAASSAPVVYQALREAGALPCGLFAQTSMRIEKRFLAHGHELDSDITPLEAGLSFAIRWDGDFIGREALLRLREQPPTKKIVSIVLDDRNVFPSGGEPVYCDGRIVGQTTSAAFGYRIDRPVALALVDSQTLDEGLQLGWEIDVGGNRCSVTVSMRAVFDPSSARMRGAGNA